MKYYILLLSVFLLGAGPVKAEYISPSLLDETFTRVSEEVGVPVKLLRGICWAESKHQPGAYNHGDGVGTNHAFGMCQVLHSTARDFGFKDANCYRDFRNSKTMTYNDCKLFGIYTNIFYGAKFLKTKLDQYEGNWEKAAAAYNAGSVRVCKTGKVLRAKDKSFLWNCKKGGVLNQKYVDDVLQAIRENR